METAVTSLALLSHGVPEQGLLLFHERVELLHLGLEHGGLLPLLPKGGLELCDLGTGPQGPTESTGGLPPEPRGQRHSHGGGDRCVRDARDRSPRLACGRPVTILERPEFGLGRGQGLLGVRDGLLQALDVVLQALFRSLGCHRPTRLLGSR